MSMTLENCMGILETLAHKCGKEVGYEVGQWFLGSCGRKVRVEEMGENHSRSIPFLHGYLSYGQFWNYCWFAIRALDFLEEAT